MENNARPVKYPSPKVLDLNAKYAQGQGVNKSPLPSSNTLASKVKGTKASTQMDWSPNVKSPFGIKMSHTFVGKKFKSTTPNHL